MTTEISRTAAATAARMRASEEKAALKLAERGWVCTPPATGGLMPIPTRATNFVHFLDRCTLCDMEKIGDPSPTRDLRCAPHFREDRPGGARFHYRCPRGHTWMCYLSDDFSRRYYSDCPCDYCFARRLSAGEESWNRSPVHNFQK